MNKFYKNKPDKNYLAGFTLIETLIYLAVLTLLTTFIVSFVFWALGANAKIKAQREVLDNARRAIEIITYEIKSAKNIYLNTSIFNAHPGQLSLISEQNPPPGEIITYLDFYLCGQRICLKRENTNPIALTSDKVNIDNLIFDYLAGANTGSIQINLTLSYNDPTNQLKRQASTTLVSTVTLRNN